MDMLVHGYAKLVSWIIGQWWVRCENGIKDKIPSGHTVLQDIHQRNSSGLTDWNSLFYRLDAFFLILNGIKATSPLWQTKIKQLTSVSVMRFRAMKCSSEFNPNHDQVSAPEWKLKFPGCATICARWWRISKALATETIIHSRWTHNSDFK